MEAETWQKLLRVLTHEISNSAIRLSTLSSYIYEMIMNANQDNRRLTEEERGDIAKALAWARILEEVSPDNLEVAGRVKALETAQ